MQLKGDTSCLTMTVYTAPWKFGAWTNRSSSWKYGFVIRLGPFGFVMRRVKVRKAILISEALNEA